MCLGLITNQTCLRIYTDLLFMMGSLEEKMLGEKKDYYCSSSEDEAEKDSASSTSVNQGGGTAMGKGPQPAHNTGPKGVLADWRRFKQLETEQREEHNAQLQKLTAKLALTCRTESEDAKAKAKAEKDELELEDLEEDDFMRQFMGKRMEEIKAALFARQRQTTFGQLCDIESADNFLLCIDHDSKITTVVILIYEEDIPGCRAMIGCLTCLAEDYPMIKFAKVKASSVGASKRFRNMGVPTVQAYRNGDLIGSFVRVTDELGDDFFADQVEQFLKDYGILPDNVNEGIVKSSLRQSVGKDSDSDFDID